MNLTLKYKFKEEIPENTVERLKKILNSLDIHVIEEWMPVSTIGTCSLRLNLEGTRVGSNGKGMTKDYARASAYAEFLERLQNMKLQPNSVLTNVMRNNGNPFLLFQDEKLLNAHELVSEKSSFIEMFLKKQSISLNNFSEAVEALKEFQKMDYNFFLEKDKFLCLPYYSIRDKKVIHIPYFLMNLHYGSNGMCAGNSAEEAIVQGFSEIYERMIQKKMMIEDLRFPDIPIEFLKSMPDVYNMYQIIKSNPALDVMIKDCSLEGRYPVAALIIIEKNTGKYGIKLGSHPDHGIAVERLFTEAAQGIAIENYAKKSMFDFMNRQVRSKSNIVNSFKSGDGSFPHQLLSSEADYKFVQPKDVADLTNKDLLNEMVEHMLVDGYDILVRDVSYLGFPSYHIIIPGFSEMSDVDNMNIEAENTRFHIQPLLWSPEKINQSNIDYVISLIKYYMPSLMENSVSDISGYLSNEKLPAKEYQMDNYYFLSMCYMLKGDYKEAAEQLHRIEHNVIYRGLSLEPWYVAVRKYAEGMAVYKNHSHVMHYIKILFDDSISERVDEVFGTLENIFTKQYSILSFNKLIPIGISENESIKKEYLLFEKLCLKYKEAQGNKDIDQLALGQLFI